MMDSYSSGIVNPDKLFLLYVALLRVFVTATEKQLVMHQPPACFWSCFELPPLRMEEGRYRLLAVPSVWAPVTVGLETFCERNTQ